MHLMAGWGIDYASLGALGVLLGVVLRYPVDSWSITLNLNLRSSRNWPPGESQALSVHRPKDRSRASSFHRLQPDPISQSPICTRCAWCFWGHGAHKNDYSHSVRSPSQYCPFCRPDCQVSTTHFPPGANCRMNDQTFHSPLMHSAPTKITTSATF